MIIRRRRLNEAPLFGGVKDKIANIGANLKDKITNVNGVNINDLVAKIIFGPRSINGYSGVLGQNYQAFEKLSDSTKWNFYKACKDELENNEFRFPFFVLLKQKGANEVITDVNKSFLKFYNGCLNNNISYAKANEGKKGNILLIKDLYSKSDWDKIASMYYDTKFDPKWKGKIKELGSIDKFEEVQNNPEKFINLIFYSKDEKIRSLSDIKAILSILNENEESEDDQFKKKLSKAKSEEELKKIANSLDKDQSTSLIQLLQQKIK